VIGCSSGGMQGILNAYFAITILKVEIICSLNAVSVIVWKFFMHRCGVEDPSLIWEEVMQLGIKNWGNKALKGLVYKLVFGSVVYNLWRTRNEVKHSGHPNTEE
jgi:hypothetical protein